MPVATIFLVLDAVLLKPPVCGVARGIGPALAERCAWVDV